MAEKAYKNYRERFMELLKKVPSHAKKEILKNRSRKTLFILELSKKTEAEQERFLRSLTAAQRNAIFNDWEWIARPSQLPPGGIWDTWILLAGRGYGKTYTAKNWLKKQILTIPGEYQYFARTDKTVRRDLAAGEDSLINLIGQDYIKRSDVRDLIWEFTNGSIVYGGTGEKPENARGASLTGAVFDELAFFAHPQDCLDVVDFALRKGEGKKIITTTPSQKALFLLKQVINDPHTVLTKGSTWENLQNLDGSTLNKLLKSDGTQLANMEVYADLISLEGKLFKTDWFKRDFISTVDMDQIVVSWDPAVSSDNNENGIIVFGKKNDIGYVIEDRSFKGTPEQIARTVVQAYKDNKANYVVIEKNNGGDYLPFAIQVIDKFVPVKTVIATRGKAVRAEPISQMYEKGLINHCGYFRKLEEQMISYDPDMPRDWRNSPDRLDALVWAITSLFNCEDKDTGKLQGLEDFDLSMNW
jgi:phage terminase large subunit-like protein